MLKLRHEADDRPDHSRSIADKSASVRSTRPAATMLAINGFGGSMVSRTGLAVQWLRLNARGCQGRICRLLGRLAQGCRAERRHAHSAAQRLGFRTGVIATRGVALPVWRHDYGGRRGPDPASQSKIGRCATKSVVFVQVVPVPPTRTEPSCLKQEAARSVPSGP